MVPLAKLVGELLLKLQAKLIWIELSLKDDFLVLRF